MEEHHILYTISLINKMYMQITIFTTQNVYGPLTKISLLQKLKKIFL